MNISIPQLKLSQLQFNWQMAPWLIVALSLIATGIMNKVDISALFNQEGLNNALDILGGFANPEFSQDYLLRIFALTIESLMIGVLGTIFGVIIGVSLALLSTKLPITEEVLHNRSAILNNVISFIQWFARCTLIFFRSIPDIIWAYFFVMILGLGPGPAVLAIGITSGGIIGKLYAELAETADQKPINALKRKGISGLGIWLYAIIPQIKKQWISYALFRMECNIRSGTILGVVGAGGLGAEIALSIKYFEFDKLATTLLAVLLVVILLELISSYFRNQSIKKVSGFFFISLILCICFLNIPWFEFFSFSLNNLPALSTSSWQISWPFIQQAFRLMGETIAMAWFATIVAAIFAFFLAPLSTYTFACGQYLKDTYKKSTAHLLLPMSSLGISRFTMQIMRAMPELILALIFVVWVGPGPFAGVLAICVHTIGILGRLYTDVYEQVELEVPQALQKNGSSAFGVWLYGVLPQVKSRLAAFTLYRFEVNIRATAMVGFVGAGGIGDAIHTAIGLFHLFDLLVLITVLLITIIITDYIGARIRSALLTKPYRESSMPTTRVACQPS